MTPGAEDGHGNGHLASSAVFRFDELRGSEMMHASFGVHRFAPHTHDTWTIGLVERGANRLRCGRTQWVAAAGTACVVNPGEVHTGGGQAMTYWDLMSSHALLARIFPHTPLEHLFWRDAVLADGPAVQALCTMFAACGGASSILRREQAVVEALVALFLGSQRLAPSDVRKDPLPAAARLAQDYLAAHLDGAISLADLAAETGLSGFIFVACSRRRMGFRQQPTCATAGCNGRKR